MTASILDWFHAGSSESPLLLVLHEGLLQVAQFSPSHGEPAIIGMNEVALPQEAFHRGAIVDSELLAEIIGSTIAGTQPQALHGSSALVAVPHSATYAFAKDFGEHISETSMNNSMADHIRLNCPVRPEEMSLDFIHTKTDLTVTGGAVGTPKRWTEKIKKILLSFGITNVRFMAEPLLQRDFFDPSPNGNFAVLAHQENQIQISLFRNDILFDNYFVETDGMNDRGAGEKCGAELSEAQKQFTMEFKSNIAAAYFLGFGKEKNAAIRKKMEGGAVKIEFEEAESDPLFALLKNPKEGATLLSLAKIALH